MHSVLIVDDEIGFVQMLELILKRAGYKPLSAYDADEALQMIYEHRPALVILDDMLPGMSGGDLCMTIKRDPQISHIQVIMHSAGNRVKDPNYIREIGADGALVKPSLAGEIVAMVHRLLKVSA